MSGVAIIEMNLSRVLFPVFTPLRKRLCLGMKRVKKMNKWMD